MLSIFSKLKSRFSHESDTKSVPQAPAPSNLTMHDSKGQNLALQSCSEPLPEALRAHSTYSTVDAISTSYESMHSADGVTAGAFIEGSCNSAQPSIAYDPMTSDAPETTLACTEQTHSHELDDEGANYTQLDSSKSCKSWSALYSHKFEAAPGLPLEKGIDSTLQSTKGLPEEHDLATLQAAPNLLNSSDLQAKGVASLGKSPYIFGTTPKGSINKVDYDSINQALSEGHFNEPTLSAFSLENRAALQAQCPITQGSLWHQVFNQHGQAHLQPSTALLPAQDPLSTGTHAYQLIHSLYTIGNEGYLRFDALSEGELIRANQGEISTLMRQVDGATTELNCYLLPLIKGMVRICSVLPASLGTHHEDVGGLIRHNLQVANECLDNYNNFANSKVTISKTIASLTEQREAKKKAEASYLEKIHQEAALEDVITANLPNFKAAMGLDPTKEDLCNQVSVSALAQDISSMVKQAINGEDSMQTDKPHPSLVTEQAAMEAAARTTQVALGQYQDDTPSAQSLKLLTKTLMEAKAQPSQLFSQEAIKDLDTLASVSCLQKAQAFGLMTFVQDEQLDKVAQAFTGTPDIKLLNACQETNFKGNLNAQPSLNSPLLNRDPYATGMGVHLVGATKGESAFQQELQNINTSVFENAFINKITELNLGIGSNNDYNNTTTMAKKDSMASLIKQLRAEAESNNLGRFDRYQLDLIIQLTLVLMSFAHDLGKIVSDMEIYNDQGQRFSPYLETLTNFVEQTQTQYLYIRHITGRSGIIAQGERLQAAHQKNSYTGLHLLTSLCHELQVLIYQVFNLDEIIANPQHPLNRIVAKADRWTCSQVYKKSNVQLKSILSSMCVELIKSRLRAQALAQMQLSRIEHLSHAQGLDLSTDPLGLAKQSPKLKQAHTCNFTTLWQAAPTPAPAPQPTQQAKLEPSSTVHDSVLAFKRQMDSCAPKKSPALELRQTIYVQQQVIKNEQALALERHKELVHEQLWWANKILTTARQRLSVNELGSDMYVEGDTVLIEHGSRAWASLNLGYQSFCYGSLAEQGQSTSTDFRQSLSLQNFSETYSQFRETSWFAIAVGDDLVLLQGLDFKLPELNLGSDVAIVPLGNNNKLIEELKLDLANYILHNLR